MYNCYMTTDIEFFVFETLLLDSYVCIWVCNCGAKSSIVLYICGFFIEMSDFVMVVFFLGTCIIEYIAEESFNIICNIKIKNICRFDILRITYQKLNFWEGRWKIFAYTGVRYLYDLFLSMIYYDSFIFNAD